MILPYTPMPTHILLGQIQYEGRRLVAVTTRPDFLARPEVDLRADR